ncbi:hypothetical protein [Streptomyces sp. NRRL S-1022]|uniref:hypothetical protein n=1 Tax=Streptomyces sp. NRRL S-1022 TaxID=1463880 RepID=UPI0004C0A160|nr:hypothetical protein [Streptomyces sp. NRRL S-1022]
MLPDAASLPGWEATIEPVVYPLEKAKTLGLARCSEDAEQGSCKRVRFVGASEFHQQKRPVISFMVQTYRDPAAAQAAYGTVWKAWKGWMPAPKALPVGKLGDQRNAVVGLSPSAVKGSKGLTILVRKGSVIMLSTAWSGTHVDMADSFLTRFAGVFAQRAEEALGGKAPSAGIRPSSS